VLQFTTIGIIFSLDIEIPLNELRAKYTNTASFVSVDGIVHFRDEGNQTDTIPIVLIHVSLHTFFDI
jgi:hypothetical protein